MSGGGGEVASAATIIAAQRYIVNSISSDAIEPKFPSDRVSAAARPGLHPVWDSCKPYRDRFDEKSTGKRARARFASPRFSRVKSREAARHMPTAHSLSTLPQEKAETRLRPLGPAAAAAFFHVSSRRELSTLMMHSLLTGRTKLIGKNIWHGQRIGATRGSTDLPLAAQSSEIGGEGGPEEKVLLTREEERINE